MASPSPTARAATSAAAMMPDAADADAAAGITPAQMRLVLNVSRMLAVTADLDALMRELAQATTALLACERASIFLHDARTDELCTKVALGTTTVIRLAAGAGVAGHVFRTGEALHVPRPYDDPRFNRQVDKQTGFVTRCIVSAPMLDIDRRPVGVLQAVNKSAPAAAFTEADVAMLQLLADQAGVALQRYHLQQAAVRHIALEREMQLARAVQQAMTPAADAVPAVPGLDAAGWTKPASINGGDCYDIWRLPDGRLGVLVADASGHGLAPALVVSQVRSLVRTLSESEPGPFHVLARVNARLYADLRGGRFVTAFLGYVAPDGTVEWCSAGHGPVMVRTAALGPIAELEATVPPLGILPELPADDLPVPAAIEPGGWLVVASDGITEAHAPGPAPVLFGTARLLTSLDTIPAPPPRQVIEDLHRSVRAWQGNDEPADDQTVVAIRRTPIAAAATRAV